MHTTSLEARLKVDWVTAKRNLAAEINPLSAYSEEVIQMKENTLWNLIKRLAACILNETRHIQEFDTPCSREFSLVFLNILF
jgi:hypothetical protein